MRAGHLHVPPRSSQAPRARSRLVLEGAPVADLERDRGRRHGLRPVGGSSPCRGSARIGIGTRIGIGIRIEAASTRTPVKLPLQAQHASGADAML
jgi:hypothetical protein